MCFRVCAFSIHYVTSPRTLPQARMTWSTLAHRWVIVSGGTMEWCVEINNTKRLVQARDVRWYHDTKKRSLFKNTLETVFCFSSFSDEKAECHWPRVLYPPPEEHIVFYAFCSAWQYFYHNMRPLNQNAAFWTCPRTTLPFKCCIFYNSSFKGKCYSLVWHLAHRPYSPIVPFCQHTAMCLLPSVTSSFFSGTLEWMCFR